MNAIIDMEKYELLHNELLKINPEYAGRINRGETISLYDIFGIEEFSSLTDFKKAYKSVMKLIHPDKHPDQTDYYEVVSKAYLIIVQDRFSIMDEKSKEEYDKKLKKERIAEPRDSRKEQEIIIYRPSGEKLTVRVVPNGYKYSVPSVSINQDKSVSLDEEDRVPVSLNVYNITEEVNGMKMSYVTLSEDYLDFGEIQKSAEKLEALRNTIFSKENILYSIQYKQGYLGRLNWYKIETEDMLDQTIQEFRTKYRTPIYYGAQDMEARELIYRDPDIQLDLWSEEYADLIMQTGVMPENKVLEIGAASIEDEDYKMYLKVKCLPDGTGIVPNSARCIISEDIVAGTYMDREEKRMILSETTKKSDGSVPSINGIYCVGSFKKDENGRVVRYLKPGLKKCIEGMNKSNQEMGERT